MFWFILHYIFNLEYCPHIKSVGLFFQEFVFKLQATSFLNSHKYSKGDERGKRNRIGEEGGGGGEGGEATCNIHIENKIPTITRGGRWENEKGQERGRGRRRINM